MRDDEKSEPLLAWIDEQVPLEDVSVGDPNGVDGRLQALLLASRGALPQMSEAESEAALRWVRTSRRTARSWHGSAWMAWTTAAAAAAALLAVSQRPGPNAPEEVTRRVLVSDVLFESRQGDKVVHFEMQIHRTVRVTSKESAE